MEGWGFRPEKINAVKKKDIRKFLKTQFTLFESENEWQKIEQVPTPIPRAFRNFLDVKTRNKKISIIEMGHLHLVNINKGCGTRLLKIT